MASHNSNQYTDFTNLSVGRSTGTGILRFGAQLSAALTASTDYALYVRSGALKFWNGSSESDVLSGGSGVSTFDALYDLDKTLTIDDTTLTLALTHATNDGLTVTGGAASAGDCIQITNSGTGKDINGTSSTWSISKAGALLATSIAGSATDTALTINANGTGKVTIAGTSTGAIELQSDITSAASKSLTMAGAGGSNILIVTAGDAVLSDGSITVTDADNASTVSVTNNTITSASLVALVSTSLTTGKMVSATANGLTNGALFYGESSAAGWGTGYFIQMNDGSDRFTVGADGATSIVSGVNSTVALKVTGIQTAEDMVELTSSGVTATGQGVLLINSSGNSASGSAQIRIAPSGTPVEGSTGIKFVGSSKVMQAVDIDCDSVDNSPVLINGGGAIASGKGVLQVIADGTPASGGNVVDFRFTGTATNDPAILNLYGTTKDVKAIVADVDNTDVHAVGITGSGALSAGRMLFVGQDGTPAAATDSVVEFSFTGTATNTPRILTLTGTGKDVQGIVGDIDNATNSAVLFNSGGAIADNKAVVEITADGTPAAAGSNLLRVAFTGTATNKPTLVEIVGVSKDCQALNVTADPTTTSAAYIASAGALAADKATLEIVSDAVGNADSSVLRLEQTNTGGVSHVVTLKQDDTDKGFIKFEGTAGSGNSINSDDKSGGSAVYIQCDINGTNYWIKATPGA